MATEHIKGNLKLQGGDCASVPVPPGTKGRGKLPRSGDPEPSAARMWWLIGAVVAIALVAGVFIGRFTLQ